MISDTGPGSRYAPHFRRGVPDLDSLDGVFKRLLQNSFADGSDHEAEQPSLEVLAVAYDDHVDVGQAVGATREVVGVAGRASPRVGVGRREDDVVGIGPVVMQAFPDAAGAFSDVGLRGAAVMHPEVLVRAVAKELRAARPEIGEPGNVLFGRQGGCLVQVDGGHACPLSLPEIYGILSLVLITPVDSAHTAFFR